MVGRIKIYQNNDKMKGIQCLRLVFKYCVLL